jgi:hypothetical protein
MRPPVGKEAQLERLAQLERGLDRLAQQIEQLKNSLK